MVCWLLCWVDVLNVLLFGEFEVCYLGFDVE